LETTLDARSIPPGCKNPLKPAAAAIPRYGRIEHSPWIVAQAIANPTLVIDVMAFEEVTVPFSIYRFH
jgi:hypothetical protein